ncbi:eukaryotic translation initiation factor 4B3-like isoform X1 [Coffea arabica]|uniref:Eukaryotic translation initiation factor 4B3-like isoform X1 n=1 Tax=Coffea arabica TaxID=13443 RepID=A0A6P6VRK5_COFAR|nr:eukaryotic translation initiation factor 4B3-like isoform X1 [Coffea arabica]XP_027112061.1 eukaryotic translation initiation factor 4B3-like isoform X1 [Coffea arabica]
MAATVSAWAKPGAWALDSEENEADLLQQHNQDSLTGVHLSNGAAANSAPTADFPSLATAAATKPKKKKGQTLSLQEFSTFGATPKPSSSSSSQPSRGLTHDELLALPTGPRQRSAEELDRNKGFRSYGNNYDRPGRGSSDEQPRRPRDSSRDLEPSRADEIDDWGALKKSTAGNGNLFERRERGERGGFFSDSQSRADEVDNWASNKTFVPSESRRNDRRGGFESNGGADSANWVKRKEEEGRKFGSSGGGAFDSLRERRGGGIDSANGGGPDSDSWGRKKEEVATAGGRPRLNLQPRTLPVGEQNESVVKPKGSSPFGSARPREEVLKEKGQDWKEIDEKLESVKIKEAVAAVEEKPAFGKRGFGSGNWRGGFQQEEKNERAWRKPEPQPEDARPLSSSAEKTEDVPVEEAEDKSSQM